MTSYTRTESLIAAEINDILSPFPGLWVSLADVRPHLTRWSRSEQDDTLRKMTLIEGVRLAAAANSATLAAEARAAAVLVGSQPKHLIRID